MTDADMAQTFATIMALFAAATIIAILAYLAVWVAQNRRHPHG